MKQFDRRLDRAWSWVVAALIDWRDWRAAMMTLAVLSLFAILFGICYGGYVAMIAPIIAENFGTERIGSVLGWFMSSVSLGGVLGPWFAGYAFDLWGSYDVPILVAAGFGLVAGLCALGMPSRPYSAGVFLLPRAESS